MCLVVEHEVGRGVAGGADGRRGAEGAASYHGGALDAVPAGRAERVLGVPLRAFRAVGGVGASEAVGHRGPAKSAGCSGGHEVVSVLAAALVVGGVPLEVPGRVAEVAYLEGGAPDTTDHRDAAVDAGCVVIQEEGCDALALSSRTVQYEMGFSVACSAIIFTKASRASWESNNAFKTRSFI